MLWHNVFQLKYNGGDETLRNSWLYRLIQEGIIYGGVVYAMPMILATFFTINSRHIVRAHKVRLF